MSSVILNQDDLDAAVEAMCKAAQIPVDDFMATEFKNYKEQVTAFVLALNKNYEREQQYVGLWREDEAHELAHHVIHKGKRLAQEVQIDTPEKVDQVTDDALDAINYAAFIARKAHHTARDNNIVA